MPKAPWDIRWTTEDEIKHLRKLGTYCLKPGDHKVLLQKYKVAMGQRKNWDRVIPEAIREYLRDVI
jgi:hypothetical protein